MQPLGDGGALALALSGLVDPWDLIAGFLTANPHAMQVYGADGHSRFVNPAFLEVFGSAPPPEYNVLRDDVLERQGVLDELRKAFQGQRVHLPAFWYDPRDLRSVHVERGRRSFLRLTAFPLGLVDGATSLVVFLFEDLTALQQVAEERERLLAEREALVAQSPIGIIISDAQGRLVHQNAAATEIWAGGARADSVAEWGQYRAFHADGRPYEPEDWSMARCLFQGTVVHAEEIHFQRFDGSRGIMLGSCAPLKGGQGELLGAVSMFTDISPFKELERLRDDFISVAAHELRTPTTALLADIQMLQLRAQRDPAAPDYLVRIATRLADSGRRFGHLLSRLLDVSRLEHGQLAIETRPMDLRELVCRVAADTAERSQTMAIEVLATEEIHGQWDEVRLEQVVSNLLENAVKYGESGDIVTVSVDASPTTATIAIEDRGTGVQESELPHLFDRYYRAETHRGEKGLGLGLYLVRQIVALHGGRVWAENRAAGGLRVTVELPR